jgi:protein O-mannosyl-transferase
MDSAEKMNSSKMESPSTYANRWGVAAVCLVLAAMTFAVFGQTLTHGFVNFDDAEYVYENPVVAGGLNLKEIGWVFTHADCSLYHPLTMLSLMGDYQLHGLHAGGYHFTNVVLHAASAILLFLILRQMTGSLWPCAFVAAVFAIHPLRVESVAWVSERKDVLSAFFFMVTLGAYVHYVRNPSSKARYLMVAAAFVLGLLSKPTVVTLPFVLLLLDYWPLQRMGPRKLSGLILEKIPLLALAAGLCATTVLAAQKEITSGDPIPMLTRISDVVVSYAIYLRQMVWPEGLAPFYPLPGKGYPLWAAALSFFLLALITGGVLVFRKKHPWLLVGWLWYLGMLTPMTGIVQVGTFAHADRNTYLPQIGIYLALTWLVVEWRVSRVLLGGLMTGTLALLMVCAWKQTAYWKDSETLWTHTLDCTTSNNLAHLSLGNALLLKGRVDDAITQYQQTVQIKPGDTQALLDLGNALLRKGRVDEAITQYQKVLQIDPTFAVAHNNLGTIFLREGNVDEAVNQYQQALQIKPDEAEFHNNLGRALLQKDSVDEAIAQCQKALQIKPLFAEAQFDLGNALRQEGRLDEAITHYKNAVQIEPDNTSFRIKLGNTLLQNGHMDEAIPHFQRVLAIDPTNAGIYLNLGLCFSQLGRMDEAMAQYEEALKIAPGDPKAQMNLAWLLATCSQGSLRNGARAVELAQQANAMTGGEDPIMLHTLAAAYAEAGQFSEALETAQHALRLAEAQSRANLGAQLRLEMKLYQAGSPLHVPAQTHPPRS